MKHKLVAAFIALLAVLCLSASAEVVDSARFLVLGDCRNYPGFTKLLETAKALPEGPGLFVITTGDIDPPDLVRSEISKVIGTKFPWFPIVGNHEANQAGMKYLRKYFSKEMRSSLPPQISNFTPGPADSSETTYSFDAGPVHVIAINEYWDGTGKPEADINAHGDVAPALDKWLDEDLKKTKMPWKIVVGHEPAYPQEDQDWSKLKPNINTMRHADSSLNSKAAHRDAFVKTLSDNHVAAYFCGHTHRYSRFQIPNTTVWQIDSAQARGDDKGWKYDAFLIVSATSSEFKVNVYRNLKTRSVFDLTDKLELKTTATDKQPSTQPAAKVEAAPTVPQVNSKH